MSSLARGELSELARKLLNQGQTIKDFIALGEKHNSTEQSCRTTWARVQRELRPKKPQAPLQKRASVPSNEIVTNVTPIEILEDDAKIEQLIEDGMKYQRLMSRLRKKIA